MNRVLIIASILVVPALALADGPKTAAGKSTAGKRAAAGQSVANSGYRTTSPIHAEADRIYRATVAASEVNHSMGGPSLTPAQASWAKGQIHLQLKRMGEMYGRYRGR